MSNAVVLIPVIEIEACIYESDIIIIEINNNGEPVTNNILPEYMKNLNISLEFKHNENLVCSGYTYMTETKPISIWAVKRSQIRHNNVVIDPLMSFLTSIDIANDQSYVYRHAYDFPSDYSGTILIVGHFADQEQNDIIKLFDNWQGTVYLCNLTPKQQ